MKRRAQPISKRRALRASKAEQEAAAAVDRLQKATPGNRRPLGRAAVLAVAKAMRLGPPAR